MGSGDTLAYVSFPAILLLVTAVNSAGVGVSEKLPSLSVAKFASLQLSPCMVVENSPGPRPGSQVVCERVEIVGLPRLRNLASFFSSVKVKVINECISWGGYVL